MRIRHYFTQLTGLEEAGCQGYQGCHLGDNKHNTLPRQTRLIITHIILLILIMRI
jgi:hypothetical protein